MTSVDNINININEINEYDAGIDNHDASLQFVETGSGHHQLKETEMKNPFFVSTEDKVDWSDPETRKQHRSVHVVCMKNNFTKSNELNLLYEHIVDKTTFKSVCDQLVILKAPGKIKTRNRKI